MSGLRSTSTTTIGAGIAIKFELQRAKGVELRRMRGDYSYDELLSAVGHMWGAAPKRLSVEYVDEDGDRIKVGSDAEWAEAVGQHIASGAAALRLYIRRATKSGMRRASTGDEIVVSSDDGEPDTAAATTTVAPAVAPAVAPTPQVVIPKLPIQVATAQPRAAEPEVIDVERVMTEEPEVVAVESSNESEAAVVTLLSRLYGCDAGREMMNMFSTVDFAPVVRRRLDAVAGEVIVDIDNIALRHLAVSRTNMWIGQSLYEKAEQALEAALAVWPADHVLDYNTACAAALRGDSTKAMQLLERAVQHGFTKADQIVADVDLASLRGLAAFQDLVRRLQPAPAVAAVVAPTPQPAVVPTPVVAPAAQPPAATTPAAPAEKWDPVATLQAMFPQLSAQAAARVLKRNGGDLGRAASSLL